MQLLICLLIYSGDSDDIDKFGLNSGDVPSFWSIGLGFYLMVVAAVLSFIGFILLYLGRSTPIVRKRKIVPSGIDQAQNKAFRAVREYIKNIHQDTPIPITTIAEQTGLEISICERIISSLTERDKSVGEFLEHMGIFIKSPVTGRAFIRLVELTNVKK